MQDRAAQTLAVTIAFLAVGWIAVSLRCFVRIKIVRAFGIDDWLIVISLAIYTIFSGMMVAGVHWGIGSHNADLTAEQIMQALKYQTLAELFYIIDAAVIKASVGFLLLRITPNGHKSYRYVIWSSMVVLTLWTIMTFFAVLLACIPVQATWTGKGKCQSPKFTADFGYAFSAMDIFFDWLFAVIPVPMLWDVKMTSTLKLSIILILGLGVFASTATIIRLKYIVALTDPTDILYSFSVTLIWTVVELGIGIAAASIATLRPLMKTFHIRGFTNSNSNSNGQTRRTPRSGYTQSYDLGYMTNNNGTKTTAHTRAMSDGNTSQESILGNAQIAGIQKRMDVEVRFESGSGVV